MWPMAVLRGPSAWLSRLPPNRVESHLSWVDTVQSLQAQCPENYAGLKALNELPWYWFEMANVPDTQLYINQSP